jgi:hypothetical protein
VAAFPSGGGSGVGVNTNASGVYTITGLAGSYTVTFNGCSAGNFQTKTVNNVSVTAGKTTTLNAGLVPA